MVNQGNIVKVNFNPQAGHEQAGYRPALVVSNNFFNQKTGMTILCPITNTDNGFPLHIKLNDSTNTTGVILCEHLRSVDLSDRGYAVVESVPDEILRKVLSVIQAEIE